jgi:hypothetical protein
MTYEEGILEVLSPILKDAQIFLPNNTQSDIEDTAKMLVIKMIKNVSGELLQAIVGVLCNDDSLEGAMRKVEQVIITNKDLINETET